jgi:hypothetical protein
VISDRLPLFATVRASRIDPDSAMAAANKIPAPIIVALFGGLTA